jgi:hypothetical protein
MCWRISSVSVATRSRSPGKMIHKAEMASATVAGDPSIAISLLTAQNSSQGPWNVNGHRHNYLLV